MFSASKRLRETDESLTIIWYFSVAGLLLAMPVAAWEMVLDPASPPLRHTSGWLWLLLTGVFSFFGHVHMTHGFKHTSLQLGSLLALSAPLVAVVSAWLFLGEELTKGALAGATLILGAVALLGILEARRVRV